MNGLQFKLRDHILPLKVKSMTRKGKVPFLVVTIVLGSYGFDESEEFWQGKRETYMVYDEETRDEEQTKEES